MENEKCDLVGERASTCIEPELRTRLITPVCAYREAAAHMSVQEGGSTDLA